MIKLARRHKQGLIDYSLRENYDNYSGQTDAIDKRIRDFVLQVYRYVGKNFTKNPDTFLGEGSVSSLRHKTRKNC